MANVHAPITPVKAFLQEKFLYDMDETKTSLVDCRIGALSSYPGHVLTTYIWIPETKGVFSYVPLHALQWKKEVIEPLDWNDLVMENCPDTEICAVHLPMFKIPMTTYFPKKNRWLRATYILTIDWFRDNIAMNLVKLENGQFAATPFHKSLYGTSDIGTSKLPSYKKLRQEWIV